MKLRIRYENTYQNIELSPADTQDLWVCLSLEGDDLSEKEREARIQEAWEIRFNRPDYNNWHRMDRHRGETMMRQAQDEAGEADPEPGMREVKDPSIFFRDEIERDLKDTYEDRCQRIRRKLKPGYAEMLIAIHLDGMTPGEYAQLHNEKRNTVHHRLQRAEKKFRTCFAKDSF